MKHLLTILILFLFAEITHSQIDTIGQFTFKEKVGRNFYETSQNIWQNSENGDFFIKLSSRKMNINASFRSERKEEWLSMIERFEKVINEKESTFEISQTPLYYPIKPEIIRFSIFDDEELSAIKTTLNFTCVSGQNKNNEDVSMLVIEIPKLVDVFNEFRSLDGFEIYLSQDNVHGLKKTLQRLK